MPLHYVCLLLVSIMCLQWYDLHFALLPIVNPKPFHVYDDLKQVNTK